MDRKQLVSEFTEQKHERRRASALYFIGPVLYSYGPHFPLAYIRGGRAFFNTDKYSRTTSRHQSAARLALDRAGFSITYKTPDEMQELIRADQVGPYAW